MYFLYKDNDGVIGKVNNVSLLPKGLSKLIVKEYDGSDFRLPYAKETIIDANLESIAYVVFNCDVLKIYNLGDELYVTMNSKIREIKHIDIRKVTDMDSSFMCTPVSRICELDYRNVESGYLLFYKSQLTDIPPMKNYEHLNSDIFEDTNIPTHKERTWRKLMEINKKR